MSASDRVARLAAEAADAARVRELTTHPDVIALRVERVRAQVDALLWAGIVLGLAFTMVNVQSFAAAGAPVFSPAWWVAWLLDPMVSLVLLAVLRAEQVTARYQVALPGWARRTKWLTFAATYVMNTWTSWGLDSGAGPGELSWSGVVLHSVPPLVVFATAETGPGLRDRLTEAVHRALIEHQTAGAVPTTARTVGPVSSEAAQDGGAQAGGALDELDAHTPDDSDNFDYSGGSRGLEGFGAGGVDPVSAGIVDDRGLSRLWETAPPARPAGVRGTAQERAAALIAEGAGRRRLAHELDISEYRARQLLDRARTAHTGTPDTGTPDTGTPDLGARDVPDGDELGEHEQARDVGPQRVHAINGAAVGFGPGAERDQAGGPRS